MKQTSKALAIVFLACIALSSCASTGGERSAPEGTEGIRLVEAVELSAEDVTGKLPAGIRVAIVAFSSEHRNLSEYIMDELTGALVDGGIEVADRRNLEYVYRELQLQTFGDVSDEEEKSPSCADVVMNIQRQKNEYEHHSA